MRGAIKTSNCVFSTSFSLWRNNPPIIGNLPNPGVSAFVLLSLSENIPPITTIEPSSSQLASLKTQQLSAKLTLQRAEQTNNVLVETISTKKSIIDPLLNYL